MKPCYLSLLLAWGYLSASLELQSPYLSHSGTQGWGLCALPRLLRFLALALQVQPPEWALQPDSSPACFPPIRWETQSHRSPQLGTREEVPPHPLPRVLLTQAVCESPLPPCPTGWHGAALCSLLSPWPSVFVFVMLRIELRASLLSHISSPSYCCLRQGLIKSVNCPG